MSTSSGRLGQQLKVGDRLRAVTHGSSDTVVSSITTTDDDDVLALGTDVATVLKLRIKQRLRVQLHHIC